MADPKEGHATRIGAVHRHAPGCLAATALSCLAVVACGGSTGHSTEFRGSCEPGPATALARFVAVKPSAVTTGHAVASDGSPACTYRVHLATGPVNVTAAVNSAPQPYYVLEQVVVGNIEVFSPTRLIPPPVPVAGLGLMADWFPQYPNLEATDGYRLVTVTVNWDHVPHRELRALAVAVAQPYMHPPLGQKAIDKLLYGTPPG